VADIAHAVMYWLEEENSTKWLCASKLTAYPRSRIIPERKIATGLVVDLLCGNQRTFYHKTLQTLHSIMLLFVHRLPGQLPSSSQTICCLFEFLGVL
jgi:hypothetical protein